MNNSGARCGLLRLVLLALVAGCGGGQASYRQFLSDRHDRYCEQLSECDPKATCDIPIQIDTGSDPAECDFDESIGRDCLKGKWTCSELVDGYSLPEPPKACDEVCGSSGR